MYPISKETLVFACEHRFYKDKMGKYYTNSQSFGDQLWQRYLAVFNKIEVFARVKVVNDIEENLFEITNTKVSFIDVPYYLGPIEFLKKRNEIKSIAKRNAFRSRAYICRVPGQMGAVLSSELRKQNIPYAVEVVGDPWDVFAPGAINHPLSAFFRITGYWELKRIVKKSGAALYVTKHQLQKRYPTHPGSFSIDASNVILRDEHITSPRIYKPTSRVKLLAVGSLAQMYKSPDIAIAAIAKLKSLGIDCQLTWLGEGKYKKAMIKYAEKLTITDNVSFLGDVSAETVRKELSEADIFIHISRTEGLPRAIIEAMGAGLPCIGSRVGGIPELLEDIALVDAINPNIVANKIKEFIDNPQLTNSQAKRNFLESKKYLESVLEAKRRLYYNEVIRLTTIY